VQSRSSKFSIPKPNGQALFQLRRCPGHCGTCPIRLQNPEFQIRAQRVGCLFLSRRQLTEPFSGEDSAGSCLRAPAPCERMARRAARGDDMDSTGPSHAAELAQIDHGAARPRERAGSHAILW
jgi:hypothetical protein